MSNESNPDDASISKPRTPRTARRFSLTDINEILNRYKRLTKQEGRPMGEACATIAEEWHRSPDSIRTLIRRFQPNVDGAEAYIKANALKLAMRVVRKASVDHAIDLLSRSNVGVLAPKQEGGGAGGGFFLSVQADSCGAVVKVASVQPGTLESLGKTLDMNEGSDLYQPSAPYSGASGGADETGQLQGVPYVEAEVVGEYHAEGSGVPRGLPMKTPGAPHPNQGTFGRFSKPEAEWDEKTRQTLAQHREKLRLARSKRSKELARKQYEGVVIDPEL
jgi:hypothetical protein